MPKTLNTSATSTTTCNSRKPFVDVQKQNQDSSSGSLIKDDSVSPRSIFTKFSKLWSKKSIRNKDRKGKEGDKLKLAFEGDRDDDGGIDKGRDTRVERGSREGKDVKGNCGDGDKDNKEKVKRIGGGGGGGGLERGVLPDEGERIASVHSDVASFDLGSLVDDEESVGSTGGLEF